MSGLPADPKKFVAEGYDRLFEKYEDLGGDALRLRYIDDALARLERRPLSALDLGCGTGKHATALLLDRGLDVTGVDISARSIEVAHRELPSARFLVADMTNVDLPPGAFDLVTAFFSIIHVPRDEHPGLLQRIVAWLRPGGLVVATLGGAEHGDSSVDDNWLGVAPMYWSNHDADTNLRLVRESGLELQTARVEPVVEDGMDDHGFLWVVARKPGPG